MQVVESKQGALERPGALCSALEGVECRDSAGAQHRTGFFGCRCSFWYRLTTCLHPDDARLSVGRRLHAISVSESAYAQRWHDFRRPRRLQVVLELAVLGEDIVECFIDDIVS